MRQVVLSARPNGQDRQVRFDVDCGDAFIQPSALLDTAKCRAESGTRCFRQELIGTDEQFVEEGESGIGIPIRTGNKLRNSAAPQLQSQSRLEDD